MSKQTEYSRGYQPHREPERHVGRGVVHDHIQQTQDE